MKINLFFLTALLSFTQVYAQDYKLTFSLEGEVNSIDSVIVENATQNIRIKLNSNDTLFLTKTETGNHTWRKSESFRLKAFPNPSSSLFNLQFKTGKPENIVVRIFDFEGREIILKKSTVIQGIHSFQVKNLPTGIFIVQLNSGSNAEQIKIVNLQKSNSQTEITAIHSEQLQDFELKTKSTTDARLLGYEVYDNITVRVWPTNAPWELTRGFVMQETEPLPEEKHTFVFEYVKCEDKCGNVYNTVQIGNQIWMAENLKCPTEKSWIYDNNPNNAENYGLLYNWEDALNNAPVGWHLPTHEEWLEMEENVRITYNDKVPLALKSKVGWLSDENKNSSNGNDASGFNIVPGGARWFYDGSFYASGESAYFWTATRTDSIRATIRKITKSDTAIGAGYSNINYGFSVRYVKDKTENSQDILVSGKLDETLMSLLNAEELQIMSVTDSFQMSAQGKFEISNYQFEDNEQPPLFFTKGEDVVFGYYPTSESDITISLDDVLYFFLDLSSDIRRMELSKTELMELAIESSYYNSTNNAFSNSLLNKILPADNAEFVSSLKNLIGDITSRNQQGNFQTKSTQASTYQYEFQRDGTIKWENKVPSFSSLGLEIRKADDNSLVFGPKIIERDSYMFSPTSLLAYGLNIYMDESILVNNSFFQLTNEGE